MIIRNSLLSFATYFLCAFSLPAFCTVQNTDQNRSSGTSKTRIDGPRVTVRNGILEGVYNAGLNTFKGIPFAQAPVGELRWREPQPLKDWKGIHMADHFKARAMQKPLFSDMRFRADGLSEDCLYLNIWAPAKKSTDAYPVLVYFYGGGFVGGDGSEYRYDGASLAARGIITITVNYRLGIFGFLAHSELSAESTHRASGNYGLLDQHAALRWVRDNIASFGGDPDKITIGGESAGSISVFAQMASPLNEGLINGAIGESGAMINPTLPAVSMATAEQEGFIFMKKTGYASIAELRSVPAEKLLELASSAASEVQPVIDGYFFPEDPAILFQKGKQARVPLLVGWNSAEGYYGSIIKDSLTTSNYNNALTKIFGDKATEALTCFPGNTKDEMIRSATELAADRFIVFSTWKWADLQQRSGMPVYRYLFSRVRQTADDRKKPAAPGASHSSEIEYALGNLKTNPVFDWNKEDYAVSDLMETYFSNFIKTGNPNGKGLPEWKELSHEGHENYLNIDVHTETKTDLNDGRFKFLNNFYKTRSVH